MNHEKHQYHFEKYLRDEMSDTDKISFEEKLSEDIALRRSFNEYKKNRATHLEKLVKAHEASFLYSKLSSAIYLLVSITGIGIAATYYLDNEKLREENKHLEVKEKQKDKTLWDKIPLFGSTQSSPQTAEMITEPEPAAMAALTESVITEEQEMVLSSEIALDEPNDLEVAPSSPATATAAQTRKARRAEPSLLTDLLLHDTFLVPIEKEVYELRFKVVRSRLDSLNNDSITDLQYTRKSKGKLNTENPVLVEFWKSPVNYHGYRFNGKKLMLYGIGKPYAVNVYQANDVIILRFSDKSEYKLTSDNEFHKF